MPLNKETEPISCFQANNIDISPNWVLISLQIIIYIKNSKYIFFGFFYNNILIHIIDIWEIIQRKKEYNDLFVKTVTSRFIF